MKKIHFILAIMAMICLPGTTTAQIYDFIVGGIPYKILSPMEHTVEVPEYGCNRLSGNVPIPATVTHDGTTYSVVALADNAFYGSRIIGVSIPSSVTRIGYGCFMATNLTSITVPATVTYIGPLAFASTGITAINVAEDNPSYRAIDGILYSKDTSTLVECPFSKSGIMELPQQVKHIAPYGFAYCQTITGYILPEGMQSIGFWSFVDNQRLSNITIPSTVSHIEGSPFANCMSLDSITIAEGNSHYYMDGLMLYSTGGDTLLSCHKSTDTVRLPSTLHVLSGFAGNGDIRHVVVPDSVTTILDNAFNSSTLTSIDLPRKMDLIGEYAFYNCDALVRANMPDSLSTMGMGCFENDGALTTIVIPNGMRIVPRDAFYGCESLASVTFGNDVVVIDSSAFGGCALGELVLPPLLRTVRLGAFSCYTQGLPMSRVVFNSEVDTIEQEAFTWRHIGMLRLINSVPPVTVTMPEYGNDYGCLFEANVDTILIPCGSLQTYLTDNYWNLFADKFVEDCNSLDKPEKKVVTVFPNPATNRIVVDNVLGYQVIELVNILGQTILRRTLEDSSIEITVGNIPRGAYLLRLHGNNGSVDKKMILQ